VEREDHIKFRVNSSHQDYEEMEKLFAAGRYAWCLFVGHLVIEKLLKACYMKMVGIEYPRIHNLGMIAQKASLGMNDKQRKNLDFISGFHIEARYPDVKHSLYKKATHEFTLKALAIIKETREWLIENL